MKGGIFLPRQFRTFSLSKIYHIIFKGIDDTNIFYTSEDKSTFLEKITLSKKEFPFKIYAYCLMNNHVHLIIEAESNMLSKSMKSLLIRYVYYFNKTYQRKGPLFQNRFYSKNVENQDYFLSVCSALSYTFVLTLITATIAISFCSFFTWFYNKFHSIPPPFTKED